MTLSEVCAAGSYSSTIRHFLSGRINLTRSGISASNSVKEVSPVFSSLFFRSSAMRSRKPRNTVSYPSRTTINFWSIAATPFPFEPPCVVIRMNFPAAAHQSPFKLGSLLHIKRGQIDKIANHYCCFSFLVLAAQFPPPVRSRLRLLCDLTAQLDPLCRRIVFHDKCRIMIYYCRNPTNGRRETGWLQSTKS